MDKQSNYLYNFLANTTTSSSLKNLASGVLNLDAELNGIENKKLKSHEEILVIMVFSIVIVLGIFGNLLVIWTVIANKNMRTSNNLFILNLAISDLTLCIFSIPFNAYKVLRHDWIFGEFLCRLTPFFQAINVFVSSMSITAIALDR